MAEIDLRNEELLENENEDTQKDRYLTFKIAHEEYGIEIRYVVEIIGMYKITPIPEVPSFVKGVINLRGKVIPVIDIRLRFNMDFKEYDERTCIIVVKMNNTIVGLIVDTINEVVEIPESQVDQPTSLSQNKKNKFVQGLGKVEESVKILLDINKLLKDEELAAISAVEE